MTARIDTERRKSMSDFGRQACSPPCFSCCQIPISQTPQIHAAEYYPPTRQKYIVKASCSPRRRENGARQRLPPTTGKKPWHLKVSIPDRACGILQLPEQHSWCWWPARPRSRFFFIRSTLSRSGFSGFCGSPPFRFGWCWQESCPRRVTSTAALALWLICACLAGSELALRIVSWTNPSPLFARLDGSLEDRLHAFKVSGPYFQGFPINSQGWNDEELHDKAPGMVRVVSISDSFAWGATPHYYHFSTVWERHAPGVEVVNLGYPGTGLDAYLYILKYHALPLDPDLIVINIFVGNDIVPAPVRADPGFLRRWFDRDNLMTYTVPFRVIKLAKENLRKKQSPMSVDIEHNGDRPVVNLTRSRDGVPLEILRRAYKLANCGKFAKGRKRQVDSGVSMAKRPQLEQATFSRKTYLEMAAKEGPEHLPPHSSGRFLAPRFAADYVEKIIAAAGDTPVAVRINPRRNSGRGRTLATDSSPRQSTLTATWRKPN